MKKMMLLAMIALFGAGIICAAITVADLEPKAIRTATAALPKNQRQDYARQIIEAVAAQPTDEVTKTQQLTSTARALIAGARTGGALGVIAEIFNTTPITNLQAVADLLSTNNFGQKLNGMTNQQFNTFATKLIKGASEYIMATGTDSPTLRISILVAAFTKASEEEEITRGLLIAALPESMRAAAATYITASEQNNIAVIAAAAGVDAVEATPADPDADNVVKPEETTTASTDDAATDADPAAETSAETPAEDSAETPAPEAPADAEATPVDTPAETPVNDPAETPAAEVVDTPAETPVNDPANDVAPAVVSEDPAASDGDAKVPLLARVSNDVIGQTLDAMHVSVYDWDAIAPEARLEDPMIGTLPGVGPTYVVPGDVAPNTPVLPTPLPTPSPAYGNQRTY